MSVSPIPSTPLNGISVSSKWNLNSSAILPEALDVRKKLFPFASEDEAEGANEQKRWSPTSDYYSRSANELSTSSDSSQGNSFCDDPPSDNQEKDNCYATNDASPCKRLTATPNLKRQRLFSPMSPLTPDKFPTEFCSPDRPDFSPESSVVSGGSSYAMQGDANGDAMMMDSPLCMERLRIDGASKLNAATPSRNLSCVDMDTCPVLDTPKSKSRVAAPNCKRRCGGTTLTRNGSRGTNVNPFTPTAMQNRAERLLTPGDAANTGSLPKKKLALRERNVSRYNEEFREVCMIGQGSFGTVYLCTNRLDGCDYALKKSHKPVAGSSAEQTALREVCAHAALGSHLHLVRYYSAWAEQGHMIIQNEYCDGGSLSTKIRQNLKAGLVFSEVDLKKLLTHVSLGLEYIHSKGLVHLDIKPENIFISSVQDSPQISDYLSEYSLSVENSSCMESERGNLPFVYKIGDMGLVSSVLEPRVEDGDCRYLPKELLQENYSQLCKSDVFSLGLTIFQAGDGSDLPKNGEEWHKIRDVGLPELQSYSQDFNKLLAVMVHKDPLKRPTASELVSTQKTKAQLYKELHEEKIKNELLLRELKLAREQCPLHEESSCGVSVRRFNL